MARKIRGVRKWKNGWQAYIRVNGHPYYQSFPLETPLETMRNWRRDQRRKHRRTRDASGSFAANVAAYLAKPEVAAMQSIQDRRAHLELWLNALGRERARASITRDEVERVLQGWLKTCAEPTVYHRRTALLSFFKALDGAEAPNPVRGTTCPRSWIPRDQSVPFDRLLAIWSAMPDARYVKKGIQQASAAKIVAAVLLHTGVRGGDWLRAQRRDIDWTGATAHIPGSDKGHGAPPYLVPLTPAALEAVRAFDAANLYGAFVPEAVSHSFKLAARRVEGPHTPIHLYSLRHSIGATIYALTGDLATAGRFLGHVPGSQATAQYALGGNRAVDLTAVTALAAARAVPTPSAKVSEKVSRKNKQRAVKQLRRRA